MSIGNDSDLTAYDGEGNASVPDGTGYVTLDVDSHYFEIPQAQVGEFQSIHIITGALIAGTFTIETCNIDTHATKGVTSYNEVSGNWINEDPTGAYVGSTGTGWTWTLLTGVKTAGVGGAMIHLGNLGSKRCRVKAAITTGGTVRVICHGKS